MTVTLVDLDPATTPVAVSISRPTGDSILTNGVLCSGLFGISGSIAYFDPASATIGDGAALGYDGSNGRFFLKSGDVNDQPHLMLLREARHRAWRQPPVYAPAEAGRPARPPRESVAYVPAQVGRPARPWKPLWATEV